MEKNTSLDLFYETALRRMYSAEKQMSSQLSVLIDYASSAQLIEIFSNHQRETQDQIERLEEIFQLLDIDIHKSKTKGLHGIAEKGKEILKTVIDMNFADHNRAVEGVIQEADELLRHFGKSPIADFVLAGIGRQIEQFEIASYDTLCTLATWYKQDDVLTLLGETINEEETASDNLLHISQEVLPSAVKVKA